TELEVNAGMFTGLLAGPVRWGQAKADAVEEFATENEIDLTKSYTYSNGSEDVPFLSTAGHPRPLNPDKDLEATARERGWPVANFKMPHRHNPITLIRSAAALGALGFGVAAGATTALLNADRSTGAAVAATVSSELSLAVAGVKLNVVGEQYLWSDRPAVFLFNHQSQLDMILVAALLRRDFTGVAKKQLEHDPVFAPMGYLADVAYIDRTNRDKALEALEPVVAALKNGRSIAIAPEGTRSPTPRLLPFKKGPFHMAMQAGVPVVPIVMRNAGDIMRPHSFVISNGTVDIAVLKPISTKSWTTKNIAKKVDGVRDLYLKTFAHWPAN
ncbi:MAG: 1-acyl-sn-glycerol-3-phosphate acyltransferase, partial [Candidatus Nanopelagicales bacterium]